MQHRSASRPDPAAFGSGGRPRARGLGLPFGGETGPLNAITDVAGVSVGAATLIRGRCGAHRRHRGAAARRTARLLEPVFAGFFALNGNGEMTGTHWIEEAGCFQGPLMITNTLSVGIVHHATVRWLARRFPEALAGTFWPMPVVAETYDGWLNDVAGPACDRGRRNGGDRCRGGRPGGRGQCRRRHRHDRL